MLKINYEIQVRSSTAMHRLYITARGDTPQEVIEDAKRKSEALGAFKMTAIGSSNTLSDWEAVFGTVESPDQYSFLDRPRKMPKNAGWLRKILGVLKCR
jgi:hypothetical protein